LVYHQTGEREKAPRVAKGAPIPKATLRAALRESGEAVGRHLRASLTGGAGIRMFTGQPVRWMGYLIAHESHHRGQILLGLKQRGMRLPERVALQGVWGKWFWGK
ncbi:MAG TPA: hypothetical protein VNK43_00840, partial [Gemmatimonadales bacterium]|nr:hypothetical protein [Gemmatimonadales bacterium]